MVLALLAIAFLVLAYLSVWLGIRLFRAIGWHIVTIPMAVACTTLAVKKLLKWHAGKRAMEAAAISDRARAYFEGLSAGKK